MTTQLTRLRFLSDEREGEGILESQVVDMVIEEIDHNEFNVIWHNGCHNKYSASKNLRTLHITVYLD